MTAIEVVNSELRSYVEAEIIPRYDLFDAAHRRNHVDMVIRQSMQLAEGLDVDADMVYAIAAYHDTGLAEGREVHHEASARIIRADSRLRQWFTEDEIETMADAAEDHRASAKHAPRTIYGRIVAEADRQIDKGNVTINGKVAGLGDQVEDGDCVLYMGQKVTDRAKPVVIAFNKPKGIVCTADKREKDNIIDYIDYPTRIYPIGRLDKDSTGLILLTNRGEVVNGILKARNYHEKEYIVRLDRPYSREFLHDMRTGVYLEELDTTTRKCIVRPVDDRTFSIILTQGLNRQIRRMCKELGYRVVDLKRIRVINVRLGGLETGKYREVKGKELSVLLNEIEVD